MEEERTERWKDLHSLVDKLNAKYGDEPTRVTIFYDDDSWDRYEIWPDGRRVWLESGTKEDSEKNDTEH